MNKLFHYFCDHRYFYLLSLSFIGIFYIILYLYDALIFAIHYATLLCVFLLVIYFCIDFYHYRRQSQDLDYLLDLDDYFDDHLPLSYGHLEKQYQQLLHKTYHLYAVMKEKQDTDYQDMIDYFTLWVHQIKTPIFALRLLIQSQEASLQDMLLQILRIEQYVEMTLHYIKLEHISSDLKLQTFALEPLIQDIVKKQAPFFIQKKLSLRLDPIDLQVLSDEKWLSFVIEQILSNALKYTKTGFIHIYVKDEVLYIQDSGIGIKKEDLPRIFEKGFTGYNGRMDKKASGLGLYLCQNIISHLGHHIAISSCAQQGTLVSIDFHVKTLQVE